MRNFFNLDGPIAQFVGKLATLIWMNTLWFLCCLPVITIGASTTAMNRMMFNLRNDKACNVKEFFRAFASNFVKATVLWVILFAFLALLGTFYYAASFVSSNVLQFVMLVAFCAVFMLGGFAAVYLFPLTAYFENTVGATLRNALLMSVSNYRQTVVVFALTLLPVIALFVSVYWFLYFGYIWVLIAPACLCYLNAGQLLKVFGRYTEEE